MKYEYIKIPLNDTVQGYLYIEKRTAPRDCPFISEPTLHRSIIRLSYAFLAISTNFANAAASCTAKSANILRLISTPAFVKPAMKRL